MGWGDLVMATADARRAKQENPDKDVYLGNGQFVEYDHDIFRGNPNISPPGDLKESVEAGRALFVPNYTGCRPYIKGVTGTDVVWNEDFRAVPGDLFPDPGAPTGTGYVLIEPHTKGTYGGNKSWYWDGWCEVVRVLSRDFDVVQNGVPKRTVPGARHVTISGARKAIQQVANASLVITTDGFLHHAAAALNIPAVVLWGARMRPEILGYEAHENIYTGAGEVCGALDFCRHCHDGMKRITPEMIIERVYEIRKRLVAA